MADAGVLAGLDIGTTGCKISVFSESGELLGGAYEAYTAESEPTLLHPNAVRCAVRSVLRRAAVSKAQRRGERRREAQPRDMRHAPERKADALRQVLLAI